MNFDITYKDLKKMINVDVIIKEIERKFNKINDND